MVDLNDLDVQTCKKCGRENAPMKKSCQYCGAFLEGYTINNVTGEYGYRHSDGTFTPVKRNTDAKD